MAAVPASIAGGAAAGTGPKARVLASADAQLDGLLDGNLKVRPMTLPDVPIDHGNYDKQINDAGLSASHIASTALSLMGQKAEAMEVLAAVTSK